MHCKVDYACVQVIIGSACSTGWALSQEVQMAWHAAYSHLAGNCRLSLHPMSWAPHEVINGSDASSTSFSTCWYLPKCIQVCLTPILFPCAMHMLPWAQLQYCHCTHLNAPELWPKDGVAANSTVAGLQLYAPAAVVPYCVINDCKGRVQL